MEYRDVTMTLMYGDIEVLRFNIRKSIYDILNEKYMPYGLRGKLRKVPKTYYGMTETEIDNKIAISNYNASSLIRWFANRVLLLSRTNAKKIYDMLDFDQEDHDENKFDIAMTCRGVSVLDKYWVKLDGENISWANVDIKRNPLNEIVAQVALHGDSLTFQGSYITPEITTNGVFAKAWRRHNDGLLWLHKLGYNGGDQSRIEVAVSGILDKCNVNHVHYEAGSDCGEYVCMCPCMTNDEYSVISAKEYKTYCSENDLDFVDEVLRIDHDNYYKMHIVDYLISNGDRHSHNWGFYINSNTMDVKSLHPLFDHNNAFDPKIMSNTKSMYKCTGTRMIDAAKFAMGEVDFHFTDLISVEDFLEIEHYDSFMERAIGLGVRTVFKPKCNPFAEALNRMNK